MIGADVRYNIEGPFDVLDDVRLALLALVDCQLLGPWLKKTVYMPTRTLCHAN